MTLRGWLAFGILSSTACVLADVSLEHRACPCLDGWLCRDDVCVPADTPLADASAIDGGADVAVGDAGAADGPAIVCPPSRGGPALVPIDTYCIDRTEVTVAQYRAFLEAGAPLGDRPSWCPSTVADTAATSDGGPPPPDVPAFVLWCDAFAFCKWAGKRLCGDTDGGPFDEDASTEARMHSQWLHACTGPEGTVYPYGNDMRPDACAPTRFVAASTLDYALVTPVENVPDCEGAYPGVFGMAGNGFEWLDDCKQPESCNSYGAWQCRDRQEALTTIIPNAFRCCAP